jgi:hypothetical protein
VRRASDADVRYGSLADISERIIDVRFSAESGHAERQPRRPLSAISRHWSRRREMSALPTKADMRLAVQKCPLSAKCRQAANASSRIKACAQPVTCLVTSQMRVN